MAAENETPAEEPKVESEYDFDVEPKADPAEAPAPEPEAAAEPEEAKAEKPAETPAESRSKHPDWLYGDAEKHGISRQEADLWTAGELLSYFRTAARQESTEQPKQQAEPDPLDLPEQDFDPVLNKTLKGIREHYDKRIGELETKLSAAEKAKQEQENQKLRSDFDGLVDALPGDIKAKLQYGADTDRAEFTATLGAIMHGQTAVGKKLSLQEGFKRAVRAMYGEIEESEPSADDKELSRRKEMFEEGARLTRPTKRQGKLAPKGDKAAIDFIESYQREHAITAEQQAELQKDFL